LRREGWGMYPKNYKNENKVVSTNVFTKKINP
jgi:hypothetical protein